MALQAMSQNPPKSAAKSSYGAKDITVLEGLDPVRKRPGMYIGSTGPSGLHHLIWEVVDNSVDEAMAGRCDRIDVTLLADGGVRVVDNGHGIPVGMNKAKKKSGVELALTVLHAGLEIRFKDERPGHEQTVDYKYAHGIIDFVKHLNQSKEALFKKVAYFNGEENQQQVEVALQWNTGFYEGIHSFANGITTG